MIVKKALNCLLFCCRSYALTDDGRLHVINMKTGSIETSIVAHEQVFVPIMMMMVMVMVMVIVIVMVMILMVMLVMGMVIVMVMILMVAMTIAALPKHKPH